ncbi:hypothetical protein I4U23_004795 [Adineta vaga]|nr:hypothetical protein I4U23_004795 [Adineta vaga]
MNILDLPNELLIIIFKKLNTTDALYSLVDVNERLSDIVLDSLHIRRLDAARMLRGSHFDPNIPMNQEMLSKICEKILSQLHLQLNELVVEQYSFKTILLSNIYPKLFSLSFANFQEKILLQYLREDSNLRELLSQQITHLTVGFQCELSTANHDTQSNIFALILYLCQRLYSLNLCQLFSYQTIPVFIEILSSTNVTSSTLTTLKINIKTFGTCLYILDGRFACLRTLIVHIQRMSYYSSDISKAVSLLSIDIFYVKTSNEIDEHCELFSLKPVLPTLKYFLLISLNRTRCYEKAIPPLIRRMINLEELSLLFAITRDDTTYIDGIQLHDQTLTYMTKLNRFTFSIITFVYNDLRRIRLPSNDDIQRSFNGDLYYQVGSYVDGESLCPTGSCHIYSLPYEFEYFLCLNNSFRGGAFDKVRYLTMTDSRPFELKFFKIISESFPCLNELHIHDNKRQVINKYDSTLIIFSHLMLLNLINAHLDYAKQFISYENISVPFC